MIIHHCKQAVNPKGKKLQVFFLLDQFSIGIYKQKDPSQWPGGRREQVSPCEVSNHITSSWQTSIQPPGHRTPVHNHDTVSGKKVALTWVTSSTTPIFSFQHPIRALADTPGVTGNNSGEHFHGPDAGIPTTMSSNHALIRSRQHGGYNTRDQAETRRQGDASTWGNPAGTPGTVAGGLWARHKDPADIHQKGERPRQEQHSSFHSVALQDHLQRRKACVTSALAGGSILRDRAQRWQKGQARPLPPWGGGRSRRSRH